VRADRLVEEAADRGGRVSADEAGDGFPSRKTATVGMLWMPYRAASSCSASTSTLTSSTMPSRFAISVSIAGPSARHGPHHAAQKSTTTGSSCERSITSCWNVAVVTSIGSSLSFTGLRRR
jgi:hypothetical protein